jgi:ABC-type sugar transport system ATPase subunit
VAVVIVSSELDEIYALSDRIAVMYEGKIVGFRAPDIAEHELGMLMAGAGAGSPGDGSGPGQLTADEALELPEAEAGPPPGPVAGEADQ